MVTVLLEGLKRFFVRRDLKNARNLSLIKNCPIAEPLHEHQETSRRRYPQTPRRR